MTDKTIAVILGGGSGSRLYPLTENRSKPAVPIAGKYRLIDIPISNCINSNIKKMFVLTMYNSASLNEHVAYTYRFDLFTKGFVDILAAEQTNQNKDWYQGTADAVRQNMMRYNRVDHDSVIILSGDQLYNMDLEELLKYHHDENADVTIATIPVVEKDVPGFGIMKVNADGIIDDFIEKPSLDIAQNWKSELPKKYKKEKKDFLASMGIYVFKREAMEKLFKENENKHDFGKEIIPYAVESSKYKVVSYTYDGYWADIGTISSFMDANLKLTGSLPEFNLYHNENKIYSRSRMLAPAKFFGTKVTHGLISGGCFIHADEISRSIIGVRSRIGPRTIIRDSIIMGNNYYQTVKDIKELPDNKLLGIGSDCFIQNAIVDKSVKIGNNVTIIGDPSLEDVETETYCIRDGIVVVRLWAHIPSNTKIGLVKPA
jgi:glucose-1-phosphate adenylyltransferase